MTTLDEPTLIPGYDEHIMKCDACQHNIDTYIDPSINRLRFIYHTNRSERCANANREATPMTATVTPLRGADKMVPSLRQHSSDKLQAARDRVLQQRLKKLQDQQDERVVRCTNLKETLEEIIYQKQLEIDNVRAEIKRNQAAVVEPAEE